MADAVRLAAIVGSNKDQIVPDKRITMEAPLLAVLCDLIRPSHLTCRRLDSIKLSRTGTDKEQVTHDRGRREYSSAGVVLP